MNINYTMNKANIHSDVLYMILHRFLYNFWDYKNVGK